jgi:hypothetical protein
VAPGLTVGGSAARGHWIDDSLLIYFSTVSHPRTAQSIAGADAEYGHGRLLVRGEWLRASFDVPISSAEVFAPLVSNGGFVEGRYRWRPRWQAAARVDHLGFSEISGTLNGGVPTPWDAPVTRVEATLGFRATRTIDVRAGWQENWRGGGRVEQRGYPTVQVIYWF